MKSMQKMEQNNKMIIKGGNFNKASSERIEKGVLNDRMDSSFVMQS